MTATTQRSTKVECINCGARNRVPAVAEGTPRCGKCSTPLRWVVDANDDEFHAVVDESSLPVLVDVWAPWCGPCRMVSPALERLAGELAGNLKLVKVNADDNPEVSRRFEVRSIPTLVLLDHGTVVDKQIGALPEHQLRSWLESKLPTGAS
ncbi:thioredoxin [Nocardioides guangzhouensis]|uniref:Thioredoxin n=1 Tax=Nocardioides guangzhouensis TaxID=2497878 RepID=A0A4V1XYU2_9ACTN|nr:thioredoxin [Nocardioides guangzhouensis]RYP84439.1 thioredoxin [Nocardioides guangzhouensis]